MNLGSGERIVPGFSGRPAIAVLPLRNGSGRKDEDYLADGLAEDLIARLSTWRHLPVIGRGSSFLYREAADFRGIGRELGVGYLVSGTATRGPASIAIELSLIDAVSGQLRWRDSRSCPREEIFKLLEDLVECLITAADPDVGAHPPERARDLDLGSFAAWDDALRGFWHLGMLARSETVKARQCLERAQLREPRLPLAIWGLTLTHYYDLMYEWTESPEGTLSEVMRLADVASTLDARDPRGHFAEAIGQMLSGEPARAVAALDLVLKLSPSCHLSAYLLGFLLALAGRPDEGLPFLELAMRLSPLDPEICLRLNAVAVAHFAAARYEEAAVWARRSIERRPDWSPAHRILAASYGHLGRTEEAGIAVRQGRRQQPRFTESTTRMLSAGTSPEFMRRFFEGLERAGWKD
ncbi:MAG: hypothetical protein ACE5FG_12485 [Myxococcota bacterium]